MRISGIGYNELLYMLKGAYITIKLCGISFFFGGMIGIIVGIARSNHKIKAFKWVSAGYIEIFRGTPLLLQLMIGFFGITFIGYDISPMIVGSVVLCLYTGAYLGEIFRSGLESIHKEQWEAVSSLGMSYIQSLRYVIFPQSIKVITPSIISFLLGLVKATSLVSIINIVDLTLATRRVAEHAHAPIAAMGGAAIIYFLLCYPLSVAGKKIEERNSIKEGNKTWQ